MGGGRNLERGVRLRFSALLSSPRQSRRACAKSIHLRLRFAIWSALSVCLSSLPIPRACCPKHTLPALRAPERSRTVAAVTNSRSRLCHVGFKGL
jgi:hypothetical protein